MLVKVMSHSLWKYRHNFLRFLRAICREVPRPSTLKQLLIEIARYEFTIRPQPVALAMKVVYLSSIVLSGSLSLHKSYTPYTASSVTPSKVLGMIDDPNVLNPNEDEAGIA